MPTLDEVLTRDSVHTLAKAFEDGLIEVMSVSTAAEPGFTRATFKEVGVPILRYVHARLMATARPNRTGEFSEFPFISDGSVSSILIEHGMTQTGGQGANRRLAGDVSRQLQYTRLAVFSGSSWYLRPWSYEMAEGKEFLSTNQWKKIRPDFQTEKRIDEEADTPVKASTDLRSIKRPDEITPEAITAFLERFVPAALKVQDELDELKAEIAKVEETERWGTVSSALKSLFG